jgi:hypothetical protein
MFKESMRLKEARENLEEELNKQLEINGMVSEDIFIDLDTISSKIEFTQKHFFMAMKMAMESSTLLRSMLDFISIYKLECGKNGKAKESKS